MPDTPAPTPAAKMEACRRANAVRTREGSSPLWEPDDFTVDSKGRAFVEALQEISDAVVAYFGSEVPPDFAKFVLVEPVPTQVEFARAVEQRWRDTDDEVAEAVLNELAARNLAIVPGEPK